jgi:hypothetical protein
MNINFSLPESIIIESFNNADKSNSNNIIIEEFSMINKIKNFKKDSKYQAEEIIKEIKESVLDVYRQGSKNYSNTLRNLKDFIQKKLKLSKEYATLISFTVSNWITKFITYLTQKAIDTLVPTSLNINHKKISVKRISLTMELSLSGSIETSITNLLKFIAGGTLSLNIEYAEN